MCKASLKQGLGVNPHAFREPSEISTKQNNSISHDFSSAPVWMWPQWQTTHAGSGHGSRVCYKPWNWHRLNRSIVPYACNMRGHACCLGIGVFSAGLNTGSSSVSQWVFYCWGSCSTCTPSSREMSEIHTLIQRAYQKCPVAQSLALSDLSQTHLW